MAGNNPSDPRHLSDEDLLALVLDTEKDIPEFNRILRGFDAVRELRRRVERRRTQIDCPPDIAAEAVAELAAEHPERTAGPQLLPDEFERRCREKLAGGKADRPRLRSRRL